MHLDPIPPALRAQTLGPPIPPALAEMLRPLDKTPLGKALLEPTERLARAIASASSPRTVRNNVLDI
jgi:hypothetical protein